MDYARIDLLIRFDVLDQQHRFSNLCCQASMAKISWCGTSKGVVGLKLLSGVRSCVSFYTLSFSIL